MTKYAFKVTRGQIYKIPENTKNQSSPPDQFLVFASSYNSSLAVPAEMSIISLTSAVVASELVRRVLSVDLVSLRRIVSCDNQSGRGVTVIRMSDTAMEFWTATGDETAAEVAARGKTESFMRQWRNTTFWDVERLDANGSEAMKDGYLHVAAVLNASAAVGKDAKVAALQAAAKAMIGGVENVYCTQLLRHRMHRPMCNVVHSRCEMAPHFFQIPHLPWSR